MGQTITLTCADDVTITAWRAEPAGKPKGGLVVCQEIFGVNQQIRNVTGRFAAAGMDIMKAAKKAETMLDILAAIGAASAAGKVGMTGFCWGGTLTYLSAAYLPGLSAAVGYYGGGIANSLGAKPKIPLMLHFGEKDTSIPMDAVAKIRVANPQAQIHTYATAGHAFNRDGNAAYDEPSATLAMARTLGFLTNHV